MDLRKSNSLVLKNEKYCLHNLCCGDENTLQSLIVSVTYVSYITLYVNKIPHSVLIQSLLNIV